MKIYKKYLFKIYTALRLAGVVLTIACLILFTYFLNISKAIPPIDYSARVTSSIYTISIGGAGSETISEIAPDTSRLDFFCKSC